MTPTRSLPVTARPIRRGALVAVLATLLVAGPAAAHPFFDPDEVPVDSIAEVTLDLAHGCGLADDNGHAHADDGDEEPTREVAVEVPAAVAWIEPAEADGWELEIERGDDGRAEVLVYTAEEGTDEPAPQFDLELVVRGEEGDELHWRILQACDETTYRWVGTEEEPAEDPAVTMTLAAADPDAPPPPEAEAAVEEPEADEAAPEEEPADVLDEQVEDEEADEEDVVADEDDGGMPGWLLIVVLVATLGIAALVLLVRTRDQDGDQGDTAA
jgi:uncharacterized protein YcnI